MKTHTLVLAALATSLAACGQMNTTPDAGPAGNVANGMALFTGRSCNGCHGAQGEGSATGPNITGSTNAGIGSWSLAEFTRAVREAVGRDGVAFCSVMAAYPSLTTQQLADLFAFLQAQKNDTVQRGQACP